MQPYGRKRSKLGSRFEIRARFAMVIPHPISLMNIMTNYSLEFGVVLRAVCPTRTGLVG